MTEFIKKKEVKKNWYKIDATNLIVGRLASEITKISPKPQNPRESQILLIENGI